MAGGARASARTQQTDTLAAREAAEAAARQRANRAAIERARREMSPPAQWPRRRQSYYNKELTEAQKKMLAPAPEDVARFAEFLKEKDTGLVKLLPAGKHEFSYTVSAQQDPESILPIRGGGAYYSFTEKTHALGPWSEIGLEEGNLFTGFAVESLGLLVSLGDVPLGSVKLSTPGVDYLAGYVMPRKVDEARAERARHIEGFKAASFTYAAALAASPDTTYVLRSMSYKKEGRMRPDWGYVPHPFEYKGADVLVAFRVVRQADDGSVTLVWKRLKKSSAPKIKKR
jgi:hypothetical protein